MTAPVRLGVSVAEFRARQAEAMSEAQLTTAFLALARFHGWVKELAYHAHDSRRSREGFPDWTMVNPRQRRLLFAELKKQDGRVSPAQRRWIDGLELAGQEAYVWRPSDILDGSMEEILRRRPP